MDDGDIRILHRTHQGVGKPDLWEITASMTVILKDMGDYVEPYKADDKFDEKEEEIPVGEIDNTGSEQDLGEEINQKLDELTGEMTPEEIDKLEI